MPIDTVAGKCEQGEEPLSKHSQILFLGVEDDRRGEGKLMFIQNIYIYIYLSISSAEWELMVDLLVKCRQQQPMS